jgi:hypothetical protein
MVNGCSTKTASKNEFSKAIALEKPPLKIIFQGWSPLECGLS